jgi:hypothetical protein
MGVSGVKRKGDISELKVTTYYLENRDMKYLEMYVVQV